jgi:Fur family ferric uptake transcriptional regulator
MIAATKVRMTRQRRVILEELERSREHPTAAQLYDTVRRRLPRISLGTVYRTLDVLSASGMIRRLELCGAPARFDANTDGHYHVRCVACGRVEDIPLSPLPQVEEAVHRVIDYQLTIVRLECLGLCPRCKAQPPGNDGTERELD